jgi:hypothetical protein
MTKQVPHLRIVVAACIAAVLGYAGFSIYAVGVLKDPTMTGDIIGTWKSFAVLAFGFWLGSSSGGKSTDRVPEDAREAAGQVAGAAAEAADRIGGERQPALRG